MLRIKLNQNIILGTKRTLTYHKGKSITGSSGWKMDEYELKGVTIAQYFLFFKFLFLCTSLYSILIMCRKENTYCCILTLKNTIWMTIWEILHRVHQPPCCELNLLPCCQEQHLLPFCCLHIFQSLGWWLPIIFINQFHFLMYTILRPHFKLRSHFNFRLRSHFRQHFPILM